MSFSHHRVRDKLGKFAKQKVINKRLNSVVAMKRGRIEKSKQTYRPNLCIGSRIKIDNTIPCPRTGNKDFPGVTDRIESEGMETLGKIQAGIKAEHSTESLHVKEGTERIIQEYDVVQLDSDSDIDEDFHAVLERVKYEDTEIKTEEIEFINIDQPIFSEVYEIPEIPRTDPSLQHEKRFDLPTSSQVYENPRPDLSLQHEERLPLLCRLCAMSCNDMIYLFGPTIWQRNILDKIQHCLAITVEETDTLSKHVCQSCSQKLESCHQFHEAVKHAQVQLFLFNEETSGRRPEATGIHRQTSSQRIEQSTVVKNASNSGNLGTASDQDANNIEIRGLTNLGRDHESSSRCKNRKTEPYVVALNPNRALASLNEQGVCFAALNSPKGKAYSRGELKFDERVSASIDYSPPNTTRQSKPHVETHRNLTIKSSHLLGEKMPIKYHRDSEVIEGCAPPPGQVMECRICKTTFQTNKELQSHASVHALTSYFPCCFCEKNLQTEKNWEKHWNQHLVNTEGQLLGKKASTHPCDECGKTYASKRNLNRHKLLHQNLARECEKSIVVSDSDISPQQDMTIGHNQREISSGDASKIRLRTEGEFNAHQEKEGSDWPSRKRKYESFCNSLEMQKTHPFKLESPYTCHYCKKICRERYRLKKHMMIHDVGRPMYKCDICSKQYTTKRIRDDHQESHSVEILFKCSICDKAFRFSWLLDDHMKLDHQKNHTKE